MNFKRVITEYWEIFWTNTYDGARKEQNMKNIRVALLLMAAFSFVMSLMNVANGNRRMLVATAILCVLFLITAFACRSERGRAVGITVCVLSVAVIFTFFVFSGGNDGFAVLWTLLAPIFLMVAVGVRAGAFVGAYFQVLFMVFFWTPLRRIVEVHYTETFLNRYPMLYLCLLIVSVVISLGQKKQQILLDAHQKELEKAVVDERNQVMQITFQTIAAITGIVDAKDQYTDQHSIRVAQYSAMIAEELGWDREEIDGVYYAALLHVIGKVGIRDGILNKSGGLDEEEFRAMKAHTTIGAKILSELTVLKGANEGALYHHEKYDGSGYPFGLKGEAIPMVARIICLADSFDAMNTKRSYKEKYEENYILDEIRSGRSKHFDPDVTDAFLRCVENRTIVLTKKHH